MREVLIAFDQLLNAVLGGSADETMSARAHRMRTKDHRWWGWTANAIDVLFFFDPDHCRTSYEAELQRRHLPSAYQQLLASQQTKD